MFEFFVNPHFSSKGTKKKKKTEMEENKENGIKEDQENEIESLKAIFTEDFYGFLSRFFGISQKIKSSCQKENEDGSYSIAIKTEKQSAVLKFEYTKGYPQKAPKLCLFFISKLISLEREKQLEEQIWRMSREMVGTPMVFTLYAELKEKMEEIEQNEVIEKPKDNKFTFGSFSSDFSVLSLTNSSSSGFFL